MFGTAQIMETETQYYSHGPFHLAGGTIPNAITAYRTHGDPSNPCIVLERHFRYTLCCVL